MVLCFFPACRISQAKWLTHWGRVTHICVGKTTIIGSDNGLSPGRRQVIIWTNAGIFLIGPLDTNFDEILIEIHTLSFKKIHLKMSSGKWRPFCLGLNELMPISLHHHLACVLWHWTSSTPTWQYCRQMGHFSSNFHLQFKFEKLRSLLKSKPHNKWVASTQSCRRIGIKFPLCSQNGRKIVVHKRWSPSICISMISEDLYFEQKVSIKHTRVTPSSLPLISVRDNTIPTGLPFRVFTFWKHQSVFYSVWLK